MITVSIVSHRHGQMVPRLVDQLLMLPEVAKVVVTLNVEEDLVWPDLNRLVVIRNQHPKGFGANHNAAFHKCETAYFCVLNPDVLLLENPFGRLIESLSDPAVALVGPLVVAPNGRVEDSIRTFPTFRSLLCKALYSSDGRYQVSYGEPDIEPDWIAGMFMLFRSADFVALNGFDEAFFLYYEDVDICKRVWQNGRKVIACLSIRVMHDARRDSRKVWRYRWWHARSLLLYLVRYAGRRTSSTRR